MDFYKQTNLRINFWFSCVMDFLDLATAEGDSTASETRLLWTGPPTFLNVSGTMRESLDRDRI